MEACIFDAEFAATFAALTNDEQIQRLKKWETAKKRPDAFPAVQPYNLAPPNNGSEPEILGRTWYSEKWDDPSFIQCNTCKREHKFGLEQGYFAIYPDGGLFIAGPKCGRAMHKKRMRQALDKFRRTEIREWENGELFYYVENFDALRDFYQRSYAAVEAIIWVRTRIQKSLPQFFSTLRSIERNEGRLTVSVQTTASGYDDRHSREIQTVGRVGGIDFFTSKIPGKENIKFAREKLQTFFGPNATADQLMEQLAKAEEHDEREKLRGYLADAFDRVEGARAEVQDAIKFFADQNLNTLVAYSRRRDALYPLGMAFSRESGRTVLVSIDDNRGVDIPDDIFAQMTVPAFGDELGQDNKVA